MIELTEDEVGVLGRPNFACAPYAKLLISSGMYQDKAKSAEYEQAVFIHFSLELFKKHGHKWKAEADKIISELLYKQDSI